MRIIKGQSCVVKSSNSQIALFVPRQVHGLLLGAINANLFQCQNLLSSDVCLISPICGFSMLKLPGQAVPPDNVQYMIKVPHIVKDVRRIKDKIQVWHDLDNQAATINGNTSFGINQKYIYIHTNHFSPSAVVAESIECCCRSAIAHVYASLKHTSKPDSMVTVKTWFSSPLFRLPDYQKVSLPSDSYFLSVDSYNHLFKSQQIGSPEALSVTVDCSGHHYRVFQCHNK